MKKKAQIDWIAVGALVTATLVWASSFIALKSAIGPVGPISVIFGRMFIASLCFVLFIKSFFKFLSISNSEASMTSVAILKS